MKVTAPLTPASAAAAQEASAQAAASQAQPVASSDLGSPTPSTTAQMVAECTSHSCLTQEAELTLPGTQAQDGSVITKATCLQSSVKHSAPGIFTVSCEATYTDGSVWQGLATIQPAADQFSRQPQYQVS